MRKIGGHLWALMGISGLWFRMMTLALDFPDQWSGADFQQSVSEAVRKHNCRGHRGRRRLSRCQSQTWPRSRRLFQESEPL